MLELKSGAGISREFPPRIWACNRGRGYTVSLCELMEAFHVHNLLDIVSDLGELATLPTHAPESADAILFEPDADAALSRLEAAGRLCADFGFSTLFWQIERDRQSVKDGCSYIELGRISDNLKTRIHDELATVLFLWIQDRKYYAQDELFGEVVAARFSEASFDIEEAGSCYALGRYTACVFHLMRVAECGLRAIAKRIQFPDDRPMWETVLNYIDSELDKKRNEVSDLFKGDIEFIAGISAHMHAVNLAWRRKVAHVERTYTQDEAKRILDTTKNIMQHLAMKLSESD